MAWPATPAAVRPMLEFVFDTTRTVSDLVFAGVFTRYPGIQWVFTHSGGTLPLLRRPPAAGSRTSVRRRM